jgi:hypothetical protein
MDSHVVSSICPTWLVVNHSVIARMGWRMRPVFPLFNSPLNSDFLLVVGVGVAGKPSVECSDRIIDSVELDVGSQCS